MKNTAHRPKDGLASSSLLRPQRPPPPEVYLERILEEISQEFSRNFSPRDVELFQKLFSIVRHDYQVQGLIGRGYHCLEHSLEVLHLTLKVFTNPKLIHANASRKPGHFHKLHPRELLELAVAALLHDYDPHSLGEPPKVDRTLYTLRSDEVLKDGLLKMGMKPSRIGLLIERTEYPFTPEKQIVWNGELLFCFHDEASREEFRFRAGTLALIDKGSTYFSLSPEAARRRVEALAVELRAPKEPLISHTRDFLVREKVNRLAELVPDEFRQRWLVVKRYFDALADGRNGSSAAKNSRPAARR